MRKARLLACSILVLCASAAFAGEPYLVADLNPNLDFAQPSQPAFIGGTTLNGAALFLAQDAEGTSLLWRTDGTTAGTSSLIQTPLSLSGITGYVTSGGQMYLGVQEPSGFRMWRTDGTAAGTVPLTEIANTVRYPLGFAAGRLLLLDASMRGLQVLDGATLTPVSTIRTAPARWTYAASQGGVLFLATEAGLWRTDGTAAGTVQISSVPATRLRSSGGRLFFVGNDATSGGELWTSDGTAAGTRIVVDLREGSGSTFGQFCGLTPWANGVLFVGSNGEIGTSDGTAASTRILLTGPPLKVDPTFARLGDTLFFPFDDGVHGRELWRSDGSAEGTRLVRDASDRDMPIYPLIAGATKVYYYGSDRGSSDELFESDGTEAGTRRISPSLPGWRGSGTSYHSLVTNGDTVFFSADDGIHGAEPWIRDANGARQIANLAVEAAGSSTPRSFVGAGDRLYFYAKDEIWRTNGTADGTVNLHASGELLATAGNTLFFSRRRASLWKTDGTPGSEVLVKDFDQGFNIPSVADVANIAGTLYVRADDGRGTQLYATDGTAAGTTRLTNFSMDGPMALLDLAGRAFFISGRQGILHATEGTVESTRTIASATDMTSPWTSLIPFHGEMLFFAEHQRTSESVLWKFSGTGGHAEVVKRFPGSSYIIRPWTAAIGDTLLFTWQAGSLNTNQLWKTDGTPEGTSMVREFYVGPAFTSFTYPVSLGDRVVFGVDDGVHGVEPWVTDGTPAGTVLLRDINGAGSSNPGQFVAAEGVAYFSATDEEHGDELWRTDGTPAGTQLVKDLVPGRKGSSPRAITVWQDKLYMAAWTPETGTELWAMPLTTPTVTIDDVRVRESAGSAVVRISLTRAPMQPVTVSWRTFDGVAKAGRDYSTSSGAVTFAAGELAKTIAVPILDDGAPGMTRSFTVRLENGSVPIERVAGAVIIEDDDARNDLILSLLATDYLPLLKVENAGPSAASNVRLCYAALPGDAQVRCLEPRELAAGESFTTQVQFTEAAGSIVARVTQWEPDTDPANNAKTWLAAGWASTSLFVWPAVPRAGETGTVTVGQYAIQQPSTVTFTSSDAAVLTVEPTAVIPAGARSVSVPFTALRSGGATITVNTSWGSRKIDVRVVGAGDPHRSPATLDLSTDVFNLWAFGKPNVLKASVKGVSESGAHPTGTVTFTEDDRVIGTRSVIGENAELLLMTPVPGSGRRYAAVFSGDANFLDATSKPVTLFVMKGTPSIRAKAVAGTSEILVLVGGTDGHVPGGTITVNEDGATRPVSGPLTPHNGSTSAATARGFSATSRTATITYSGDSLFDAATVTIPIDYGRHRAVQH